ncbi:MAG: DUF4288 domain-containing protein [Ferruginibacter sp.]
MNWYLAKLVYRVICIDGNHTPQFDEQIRVIRAEDELHAFNKARLLGDGDYLSGADECRIMARWKFIDVTELHPITNLIDGAELTSKITEEENAEVYIRIVQKKAAQLLQRGIHQFTNLNALEVGN